MKLEDIFKGINFKEIQEYFSNNKLGGKSLNLFKRKKEKRKQTNINRGETL